MENLDIFTRQEEASDHQAVFHLIKNAFESEEYSDQSEHFLVERLRNSAAFISELSLVATCQDMVIGHILLTKIVIKSNDKEYLSLALAPVSVLPEWQGKGVGSKLIIEAHQSALALGHSSVVLLGHQDYYPRFGYKMAHLFDISLPFDVPKENCMVLELVVNGLKGISGVVVYPKEFYG